MAYKILKQEHIVELVNALTPRFTGRDHDTLLSFADAIADATYELAWENDQPLYDFRTTILSNAGASAVLTADGTSVEDKLTGKVATADLADDGAGQGSDMVGINDDYTTTYLKTLSDIINGYEISIHRFINPLQLAAIRAGTSTHNTAYAWQEAFNNTSIKQLFVPVGLHNYEGDLIRGPVGLKLRGASHASSILRAQATGGIVFNGGSVAGITHSMPKLDLEELLIEAGVQNAGTAVTMNYTGGSGTPPLGPVWSRVRFGAQGESWTGLSPYFNRFVKGQNVRDVHFDRITFGSSPGAVGHPINPPTTEAMYWDTDSAGEAVELWLQECYFYYVQKAIAVRGYYEGVYIDRATSLAIWDFLDWKGTGPQPTLHLTNSYIGSERSAAIIDMISYFGVHGNTFNATAPIPWTNYTGITIDRSEVPGVSNQTNFASVRDNKFIGVSYSSQPGSFTETAVRVISGNTLSIIDNEVYDYDVGVRIENNALNTENQVRNRYFGVTTPEIIPAATRRAIGGDVFVRTYLSGDLILSANTASRLVMNAEVEDTNNYYDASIGRAVLPVGVYENELSVKFTSGVQVGDYCVVEIRKQNGTVVAKTFGQAAGYLGACHVQLSADISIDAGENLEVWVNVLGTAGSRTAQGGEFQTYWNIKAANRPH